MKITFGQYINNPLGEKNSVITNRGMYQKMYRDKLDKILLREGGKVKYTLYTDKNNYYVYFKIPSEVIDKFYYDTIIEFYTNDPIVAKSQSLKDYNVRFYSNDPSFVYTFAHAFIKHDLFIKDLTTKMSKLAVKEKAKEKNPGNLVGYVKSLFFAYLLMGDYGLFSKTLYSYNAEKYNKSKLLKLIDHADNKIKARQEAEDAERKKRKREKANEERFTNRNITTSSTKPTLGIKKTKSVGTVGRSKTTSKIKKV